MEIQDGRMVATVLLPVDVSFDQYDEVILCLMD